MPTRSTSGRKKSAPKCRTCGGRIYVPKGWGVGASVRKHYWRKHPERMLRGES